MVVNIEDRCSSWDYDKHIHEISYFPIFNVNNYSLLLFFMIKHSKNISWLTTSNTRVLICTDR